ncbi:hypothetical protein FQN49_000674, partial [Arthroderma sp. PD_2]
DSRHHPYARTPSASLGGAAGSPRRGASKSKSTSRADSDEEIQAIVNHITSPRTPVSNAQRSLSHSAAITPEIDIHEDVENWAGDSGSPKPKTPINNKSGSGVLGVNKQRSNPRRTAESRAEPRGVRKTSGRVGSAGNVTRAKGI